MTKRTAILLLVFSVLASRNVYSQKLTISGKGLSLEAVIEMIKVQTGYGFVYNQDDIDRAKKVTLNLKNASLTEVLDQCLKPQGFTYDIKNSIIGIKKVSMKKIDSLEALPDGFKNGIYSPPIKVSGVVIDTANGSSPLPDATIQVKGTRHGTNTDAKGHFILNKVAADATLVVSYAGYNAREIPVSEASRAGGVQQLYIPLSPATSKLDEVQTIAYGKVLNRFNTGNVTTVQGKDLNKQPIGNPLLALQGLVPGLMITQQSGAPGGAIFVQLRGRYSINHYSEPLYVVDGMPYLGAQQINQFLTLALNNNLVGGNALNMFNSADIESIDVLKDADATAIYGSHGGNGVVQITTKKGKQGPARLNIDVSSGAGRLVRMPRLLKTEQYLAMRHEAKRNDGVGTLPSDYDINGTWDTTRYTDWARQVMGGTATVSDVRASLSGGNKQTQYIVSGAFRRESTVLPDDGNEKKGSAHFTVSNTTKDKKLSLQLTGTFTAGKSTVAATNPISVSFSAPNAPAAHNADGSLNWQNPFNPYAGFTTQYHNHTYNTVAAVLVSYRAARGLELKANLGYNNLAFDEFYGQPAVRLNPSQNPDAASSRQSTFVNDNIRTWNIEPQVSYSRQLSKGVLTTLAGFSVERGNDASKTINATGFESDGDLMNSKKASNTSVAEIVSEYKYQGAFGRMTYNWKNKYLLNMNGRYDGSSRFGPDARFHFFGSVGGAWIFSEEKSIRDRLPVLSFGKLRVNYGTGGNDNIVNYQYLQLYGRSAGIYQGTNGLHPLRLPNPNISWEGTRKIEVGLDLGFLRDRFLVNFNYYHFNSYDQLLAQNLSTVTGFSGIVENLNANIRNTGLEFSFNSTNIRTKHFSWTTYGMLTIPRNSLISYPGLQLGLNSAFRAIGHPLNIVKVFQFAGVDPQNGLYRFVDSSGKFTQSPQMGRDQTVIIPQDPTLFGSVGNIFQYKAFTLEILFFFSKSTGLNSMGIGYPAGIPEVNNLASEAASPWQVPGQVTNTQRYGQDIRTILPYYFARASTRAYSDASFLRLKNLVFNYQLSQRLTKRLHMQNLNLYVKGENLLLFTPYRDLDPETAVNLPPLRLITAGIKGTL